MWYHKKKQLITSSKMLNKKLIFFVYVCVCLYLVHEFVFVVELLYVPRLDLCSKSISLLNQQILNGLLIVSHTNLPYELCCVCWWVWTNQWSKIVLHIRGTVVYLVLPCLLSLLPSDCPLLADICKCADSLGRTPHFSLQTSVSYS